MANEEHVAAESKQRTEPAEGSEAPAEAARGIAARKRGAVAKARDAVRSSLSNLRPPPLDWRTVSYGLLALIALVLVAGNWAPVRINLFGWYLDIPKALAFIAFFVLGVLAAWLWEVRAQRLARAASAEPTEAEEQPGEEQDVAV